MFGFLKGNQRKKLEKAYYARLEEAMQAQRSGDIRRYSELTEQAEGIQQQIEALDNDSST